MPEFSNDETRFPVKPEFFLEWSVRGKNAQYRLSRSLPGQLDGILMP